MPERRLLEPQQSASKRLVGFMTAIMAISTIYHTAVLPADAAGRSEKRAPIVMRPPADLGFGSVQIDGGNSQNYADWAATLRFLSSKRMVCTSTIVGERVVITSAHCIRSADSFSVDFGDKGNFRLECRVSPDFKRGALVGDIALCLSNGVLPNLSGYETIDTSLPAAKDTPIFLLGYGCRSIETLDGSGFLYGGPTKIIRPSTRDDDHFLTRGGVVICDGDSGGAAYRLASHNRPANPRSILGLNSFYKLDTRTSGITWLGGPAGGFIRSWSAEKGVAICGVTQGAVGCHDRYVQ